MDQILGQILRQAVWERLALLDELATNADTQSLVSVARTELPRLTDGWRALLEQHQPDGKGNCPNCSSRWRPQKAPCSVWQAAHQYLVASEAKTPQTHAGRGPAPEVVQSGRHNGSSGRSSQSGPQNWLQSGHHGQQGSTGPQPARDSGPQPAYDSGQHAIPVSSQYRAGHSGQHSGQHASRHSSSHSGHHSVSNSGQHSVPRHGQHNSGAYARPVHRGQRSAASASNTALSHLD